ncbi:hypothetical protein PHAVU_006G063811 [Phaseolus vulgaris]
MCVLTSITHRNWSLQLHKLVYPYSNVIKSQDLAATQGCNASQEVGCSMNEEAESQLFDNFTLAFIAATFYFPYPFFIDHHHHLAPLTVTATAIDHRRPPPPSLLAGNCTARWNCHCSPKTVAGRRKPPPENFSDSNFNCLNQSTRSLKR